MSIMHKKVVPTLQKAYFIHITKDILILFTVFLDSLPDVLSTYHTYSESKGFEADTEYLSSSPIK
jgi:hypothetical protein